MSTPIYTRLCKIQETFGVSVTTVYRWEKLGHVKFHKRGRMVFLRTTSVEAYIEGLEGGGDEANAQSKLAKTKATK